MRIFLDTRDLIPLLDRAEPCSVAELRTLLLSGGHSIALSLTVAMELAVPFIQQTSRTSASRRFNSLEELPLTYIADSLILQRELEVAARAFDTDGEYSPIDPTVKRLDRALDVLRPLPSRFYLNYPLAEMMFELATEAPSVLAEHSRRERRV